MSLVTFTGQGQVTHYWGTQCSYLSPSQLHPEHRQLLQLCHTHRTSALPAAPALGQDNVQQQPSTPQRLDHFWTKHSRSFGKNLSFHLQLSLSWSHPRLPHSQDSGILLVLEMAVAPQNHLRIFLTNINKVWKVPAVVPFTASQIWPVSLQLSSSPLGMCGWQVGVER